MAFFFTIISLMIVQRRRREHAKQLVSSLGLASCTILGYYSWQIMGVNTAARITAAAPLAVIMIVGYLMFLNTRRHTRRQSAQT